MYLKSLTLKGFKSFADKTTMQFDPGLTVVVGPNGSGKSNISDAILWVLGEQSAKQLRGQAMEDVIFSGSTARKAVGVAEVTLVLDNSDHVLPIEFSEVAITRRMYRSGESEYLINNAPSRLMDITDILHDTGLGKDTHSIISQGKLDSILASRPEERRVLVEEAAGISKHRRRKARSERRLESMKDNLVRAKDIQREVTRQLKPLERQVDKAQRHHDLSKRLREASVTLAVDDLRMLQERHGRISARAKEADAAVELAQYQLDERSAALERYQSMLEQKGLFVGDLGEQRRRMQAVQGRLETDMRLLEEKSKNMVARAAEMRATLSTIEHQSGEAAKEHERLADELSDANVRVDDLRRRVGELAAHAREATEVRRTLGNRQAQLVNEQRSCQREADQETLAYAKLEDQIANAATQDELFESRLRQLDDIISTAEEATTDRKGRRSDLEEAVETARSEARATEDAIASCQKDLGKARQAEARARENLSKDQASLAALESLDRQSENAGALTARLARSDEGRQLVECRLADIIQAPSELEEAIELLLGDDLAAFVVAGPDELARLVDRALAMGTQEGRTTIVSRQMKGAARESASAEESLAARVDATDETRLLIDALLGDVRMAKDVRGAYSGHQSNPTATFITPQGVILLPDGRVLVGSNSGAERGALERKRRIRQLGGTIPKLEDELRQAGEAVARAEQALADARDANAQAKARRARHEAELQSVSSELGRLGAQLTNARAERAQVAKRREAASEKADGARPLIAQHRAAARKAEDRLAEISRQLEELSDERQRASRAENEAQSRLGEARLESATMQERRASLQARERTAAHNVEDFERRRQSLERSVQALDVLKLRIDPLYQRYAAIQERAEQWAVRLRDRASLAEADSESLKKTIGDAKGAVAEATGELERARASLNDAKVELGKLEVQVENAVGAIVAQGYVLDEALRIPAPEDRAALEEEVASLKRRIASIGPVNEVAMEEYLRLKERADYIGEQVDDLERASKALATITRAIERKMRRQFLSIFEVVKANFADVFSMLFPGGKGQLELTDPDNLSETGIEVIAQPRGKHIQKMTLMSGGEKSLTALALLFAVYRTRTVPFYVFDEVEAALDDSNLTKLLDAIEQLKGTTQLIVISHQRRTMEQADVLYGVSMQADGVSHVVSQRLDQKSGKVVEA